MRSLKKLLSAFLLIPKSFLIALFLPFFIAWQAVKSTQTLVIKTLLTLLAILFLPVWIFGWMSLGTLAYIGAQQAGLIPFSAYVAGTGSMYPTFPKGEGKTNIERMSEVVAKAPVRAYPGGFELFGRRYFGYQLQHGDIVSFANQATAEIIRKQGGSDAEAKQTGFIKRVIALPGDTLELRDGYVKLNDQLLTEPYIASARSTYGGQFLSDCQALKIPAGFAFVMGDNRKGSDDSRFEVGLIALGDIESVIPIAKQSSSPHKNDLLKKNWRDTSQDFTNANQPTLDTAQYIQLLNQKRAEVGLKPLTFQPKLSQSALIRANTILKFNDLSIEATRSGITMEKAMTQAGYSNIVAGEAPTRGFYTAQELIDNYFQFTQTKNFLLNAQYQDTGITAVVGEINGCPTQIIVQHFGGYVPPNYTDAEKQNWQKSIDNLEESIASWEKGLGDDRINQTNLQKLLSLLHQRQDSAKDILNTMKANLWLSDAQKDRIKQDADLFQQAETLAKKLNGG